ncbi:MAG: hypothetical protein A3G41_03030 [Elusimicrobia bacterium RIFCSPLOWO2_12_FULL_59_9]|nr:MAG: hypothetical protein A3G41_03030 [Elusimicrobia bacterium RIFCSPLOWO2_12_FULL_59_9]
MRGVAGFRGNGGFHIVQEAQLLGVGHIEFNGFFQSRLGFLKGGAIRGYPKFWTLGDIAFPFLPNDSRKMIVFHGLKVL